jgi:hypothetical protein
MPTEPYALRSIWLNLAALPRLFSLILAVVSFYTLRGTLVILARLRSLSKRGTVDGANSLQCSLALLHHQSVNLRQLIGATVYLFGLIFFLDLPLIFRTEGSRAPVGMLVLENLGVYAAFAADVFLVFTILHFALWFVSSRIHSTALRLKTQVTE